MHGSSRVLLAFILLILTTTSLHAAGPAIVSVTPLPHRQVRVCWLAEPNVEWYEIMGSEGVDLFVYDKGSGTICRAVNAFDTAECQQFVVAYSPGIEQNGQPTYRGIVSPEFHFISSEPDGFDAPPLCTWSGRYSSLEGSERAAPSDLRLTDVTTASDATPRIRINVRCEKPEAMTVRKYEIEENILKSDGTTATRTTSSESCPNDFVIRGSWSDRTTLTVAAIYFNSSDQKLSHSLCTAPQTMTYGAALVGRPQLRANGEAIDITLANGNADDVLLFVNPAEPYHLDKPDQTLAVSSNHARAKIAVKPELNRLYAVARRTIQGKQVVSEPVALSIDGSPVKNITLADLRSFLLVHQMYVNGQAPASSPVTITLARGAEKVFQTTLQSCSRGEFGSDIRLPRIPIGTYALTASAAGVKENATTTLHLGEIDPVPAISVDAGRGPFSVNRDSVELTGRITPRIETHHADYEFGDQDGVPIEVMGSAYAIEATLNGKPLHPEVRNNGTFSVKASPLQRGTNVLRLQAWTYLTKQKSAPVEVSIQSGSASGIDPEAVQRMLADAWKTLESDPQAAAKAFAKVIEADPNAAAGYSGRAAAEVVGDDPKSATADAARALELDPREFRAWSYRASELIETQRFAEALESLNRSLELEPAFVHAFENRAQARLHLRQYRGAIADATKTIELYPKDAFAYGVRGEAYAGMGAYDQAIADASKRIELDAGNAWIAYNSRAWLEYKKGDFDQAIAAASKSIELKVNPWAYGTRAWARQAKGDRSGALEDLAQASQLDPNYSGVDLDQGMAEYIRGNWAQAIARWEKSLSRDSYDSETVSPLLEKARQQLRKGK